MRRGAQRGTLLADAAPGEQPDILVTCSIEQASLFALGLEEEAGAWAEAED
jgi:hypothetical protein